MVDLEDYGTYETAWCPGCGNHSILEAWLFAAGVEYEKIYGSNLGELEGHGKVIGEHNNAIETIVMEAVK